MEFGGVIYTDRRGESRALSSWTATRTDPLVFFHDVERLHGRPRRGVEWHHQSRSEDVNAVSTQSCRRSPVIVGGSFGAGHYAMCGKAYDPRFVFGLADREICRMSGDSAPARWSRSRSNSLNVVARS